MISGREECCLAIDASTGNPVGRGVLSSVLCDIVWRFPSLSGDRPLLGAGRSTGFFSHTITGSLGLLSNAINAIA